MSNILPHHSAESVAAHRRVMQIQGTQGTQWFIVCDACGEAFSNEDPISYMLEHEATDHEPEDDEITYSLKPESEAM